MSGVQVRAGDKSDNFAIDDDGGVVGKSPGNEVPESSAVTLSRDIAGFSANLGPPVALDVFVGLERLCASGKDRRPVPAGGLADAGIRLVVAPVKEVTPGRVI